MVAYVVSEVEAADEAQFAHYRELAAESIARHGGRYLVRGAEPDVVEGEPLGRRRIVIVEFPDGERLRQWYRSADYAEALEIRKTALVRRLWFVEGAQEAPDNVA